MLKEAVENGACGRDIADEFAPILNGAVACHDSMGWDSFYTKKDGAFTIQSRNRDGIGIYFGTTADKGTLRTNLIRKVSGFEVKEPHIGRIVKDHEHASGRLLRMRRPLMQDIVAVLKPADIKSQTFTGTIW